MAKLTTTDLTNLSNETSVVETINNNNTLIETALENTLSRDGTSPNAMQTNLDMNNQRILNLPPPVNPTDVVRLADLSYTTVPTNVIYPTPSPANAQRLIRVNDAGTAYITTNVAVDGNGNVLSLASLASFGTVVNPWGAAYMDANGRIEFGNDSLSTITRSASGVLDISGSLTIGKVTTGFFEAADITTPANPAANRLRIYSKAVSSVSQLHMKDSAGTETRISYPVATQAVQETGTSVVDVVTPGRQHYHPAHPKAWAVCTGGTTPTVLANYGVTTVSRPALGRLLVTLDTAMSTTNYCVIATVMRASASLAEANVVHCTLRVSTQTTTQFELECIDNTNGTCLAVDPQRWNFTIFGDQ